MTDTMWEDTTDAFFTVLTDTTDETLPPEVDPQAIFRMVVQWTTFCITVPLLCLAIYVLYQHTRTNQVAHVYVISLLLSDIVQLIGRIGDLISDTSGQAKHIFDVIFWCGIMVSVGFMVCIAMERYLLIAHPLWYHVQMTVKFSVMTSVAVWIILLLTVILIWELTDPFMIYVILLIPFPLLLFFFGGTWNGLSKAIKLSTREKRKILATLALVIGIYALLFVPCIIYLIIKSIDKDILEGMDVLHYIYDVLPFFNPLLDPVLYIFMRKDTQHILDDFPCCKRSPHICHQESTKMFTSQTECSV